MKRILLLVLIGLMSSICFADDARELPKGTLRLSQISSFAFAVSEFNTDGEKVEIPQDSRRLMSLNLGAALEMGITDWIAAAVHWTPGWNVWSDFEFQTAPYDMLTVNGGYDLFAGVRIQVLGQEGLVHIRRLRLALAPGGKIPLPSPDWEKQLDLRTNGEHWREYPNDFHAPALGGRGDFDLILNDAFFLNLHAEFLKYFPKDYAEYDMSTWVAPTSDRIDFGYKLTAEVEPHLGFGLGEKARLEVGLPLSYRMTPELEVDGAPIADSDTYLLTVSPRLTLLLSRPWLELGLAYTYPILGKGLNSPALNALTLQVRSYLRIYR
jgi:hypothetical protein